MNLILKPVYNSERQITKLVGSCRSTFDPKLARYGPWTQVLGGSVVWRLSIDEDRLNCVLGSRWTGPRRGRELELAAPYMKKKIEGIATSLLTQRASFVTPRKLQRLFDADPDDRHRLLQKMRRRYRKECDFLSEQAHLFLKIYVTV